ncbi:MAG TPA: sigma-70 domain-containing protein [Patescibacteria group bacterium]|jgi:DNA-directed RNA polymerase sigma subunit (sigma70/sigma32)|nr:sigma-70 domain-containing protein [Patescibacteria group bacterium]
MEEEFLESSSLSQDDFGYTDSAVLETTSSEEPKPRKTAKSVNPYFVSDRIVQLYLDEMGKFPVLAKEVLVELLERYQKQGDEEALHTMVVHNLRISTIAAKRYGNQDKFTYLDIIQICNQAMCGEKNAFTKYNPDKGPFVDYLLYSMRNAINRELKNTAGTVRISEWLYIKIKEARKKARELRYQLGREATLKELAHEMDLSEEKLNEYFRLHNLSICSLDDEIYSGPVSKRDNSITIGERIGCDKARPDFQVRAKEALEKSFHSIRDLLMTVADTIPKVFSKAGRKPKPGPVALKRKYARKLSPKTELLIERNFNIVVERFGLEDETLELKSCQKVADIISERYQTVTSVQLVQNALDTIWNNLPSEYHFKTKDWLAEELQKLELLIELTDADRPHLIYLLKRGNRLF